MKVFIGFDGSEAAAYWILRESINRTTKGVEIHPLVRQGLVMAGKHARAHDPFASTEFTYTRFLVPHLARYRGWALFMDCDMFVRRDLRDLFALADERYAVMCVKHDYQPDLGTKMDGKIQAPYPRKNWSSLVLWNCAHVTNRLLTPYQVNVSPPSWLHQFQWIPDEEIGAIPESWNWLEGHSTGKADIVHYTRGIPGIHEGMADAPYAKEYFDLAKCFEGPV